MIVVMRASSIAISSCWLPLPISGVYTSTLWICALLGVLFLSLLRRP